MVLDAVLRWPIVNENILGSLVVAIPFESFLWQGDTLVKVYGEVAKFVWLCDSELNLTNLQLRLIHLIYQKTQIRCSELYFETVLF